MPSLTPVQRLLAFALGICAVLLSMASALWILTWPAAFRSYYPALDISTHHQDAIVIVTWLSSSFRERSLNLALHDRKLGTKELKHFSDVRRVFRQVPTVGLGVAALTLVLALASRLAQTVIAAAVRYGIAFWALLISLLGGFAWWDWPRFFAWVHHPFFGDESWRLPDDCYSLVLFPAAFWRITVIALLLSPLLSLGVTWCLLRSAPLLSSWATSGCAVVFGKRMHQHAPGGRMPTIP